jgi:histidine triad (HIT) family protein
MADECVFCHIVAGTSPATVFANWPHVLAIVPLNPVTVGHVIVIPRRHVRDATVAPLVTGETALLAAELARRTGEACNLITSIGAEATQTVPHLHWHVVPRRAGDGLALPWTGQKRAAP